MIEGAAIGRLAALAVLACAPAAALAQAPAATAEEAIAAYEAEFDAVMASARRRGRCPRDAGGEDIVVCGRSDDAAMRVPYEPVPGAVHRIAGDTATGRDALAAGACLRLCPQPVMVNVIEAVRFVSRGLDRLLHPD